MVIGVAGIEGGPEAALGFLRDGDDLGIACDTVILDRFNTAMDAKNRQDHQALHPDAELDLRGVICPYNFVKTKLKLEAMEAGETLAVILDDGDPIKNVPRSVTDDGHIVLCQEPWAQSYRVIIQKRADL